MMFGLKTYQQTYRLNYLFSSVLFFTCLVFLNSCVNDMEEVNKTSKLAEPGVERGKNIELFFLLLIDPILIKKLHTIHVLNQVVTILG